MEVRWKESQGILKGRERQEKKEQEIKKVEG